MRLKYINFLSIFNGCGKNYIQNKVEIFFYQDTDILIFVIKLF